ncbi:MAG: hypothetical protein VYE77_02030 [Planctomycetota bacterium]|nr:hypothetical protein [Planctomycetota bacterium]
MAVVAILALAVQSYFLFSLQGEVKQLRNAQDQAHRELATMAGEVTRFRLEQSADGKGTEALLEKLEVYAPLLSSALTTKPDFRAAQREMEAILRAFESVGSDAWPKIQARLAKLDPTKEFDQIKQLLQASVRCAPEAGKDLVVSVLRGRTLPNPRLRWYAADMLLLLDQQLAQQELRKILTSESSRGLDPNRTTEGMLDPAAVAVTGFHNFLNRYARSGDPQLENTLLQVLVRADSDPMLVQETVEHLGHLRSKRADKLIEKKYRNPPGAQLNPIFLAKCLEALTKIRGEEARSLLEEELAKTEQEIVARRIQQLLASLDDPSGKNSESPR